MRNEYGIKILYKKKETVLESKSIYLFDWISFTCKVSDKNKIVKNKNFFIFIDYIYIRYKSIFAYLNFFNIFLAG